MHITHADDVSASVNFAPSSSPHACYLLFTMKADLRPLTWAYKFTREIARRMPHFRSEPHVQHPTFAPGGPASIIEHADFDTPRIVYSKRSHMRTVRGRNFYPIFVFLVMGR